MKTLQEYLKTNLENNVIDHAIRASFHSSGLIHFYIHPQNVNGETLDFWVEGNKLVDNINEVSVDVA